MMSGSAFLSVMKIESGDLGISLNFCEVEIWRDAVDGGSKKVQPGSSRSICSAYAALTPAELAENIR